MGIEGNPQLDSCRPALVTYSALISASAKGLQPEDALEVLKHMQLTDEELKNSAEERGPLG